MVTEVKNTNYWISSSALYIQLNAMGEPDYIQSSVVSGASILCYMSNVPGLGYDAGHNYQRWTLASYPSIFPDSGKKYIYVAIPRVRTGDNDVATVVFPGQRIDIYGKAIIEQTKEDGSKELVSGDQIGNENFYYIYLQGIISEVKTDTDNTRKREWEQHIDCGSLATDEAIASGGEGAWWQFNSASDTITFLKTILKATFEELTAKVAKITKLILNGKDVTGVADDTTLETNNTTIVTPQYLGQFGVKHFLAKDKDDVAHGTITFEKLQHFLKGLDIGEGNGTWSADGTLKLFRLLTNNFSSGPYGQGAQIDEKGNLEVQSIYARQFISAPKFVFNEISVTKAEQWNTNGYGTIESVDLKNRTITLHLEENDYGSLQVGDICRGIYADIDNAHGADKTEEGALDDCNFVQHKGFFTTYFYVSHIITSEKGKFVFKYGKKSLATPDPCAYMDFAQYGSFTDDKRQSSMYFSSRGNSYIEVLDGVCTWEVQPQNRVARYGWLGGLTLANKDGTYVRPEGNGIYVQDNIYFGGNIHYLQGLSGLEDLQEEAKAYDVSLSQYQSVITVDDMGNVINGLYTEDEAKTTKQYRISTAVFVRKGMDILLEEDGNTEDVTAGHYRVHAVSEDCEVLVQNSTIFVTAIKNIKDGVAGTTDDANFDYDAMRKATDAMVTIVVELEGKTSKMVQMPIRIQHDTLPFMVCDLSNESASVAWNTKTAKYIGLPIKTKVSLLYHNEPWTISSLNISKVAGLKTSMSIEGKAKVITIDADNLTADTLAQVTKMNITVVGRYAGANYEYTRELTILKSSDTVVYELIPSADSIVVDKDGNKTVNSVSCDVYATSSDDKRYKLTALPSGMTLKYGKSENATTAVGLGTAVSVSADDKMVTFALYDSKNNLLDKESIPVLAYGKDGKGIEYIFKLQNSAPSNPTPSGYATDTEYQRTDKEFVPEGWTDDPTGVDAVNQYEWVCKRVSTNGHWGAFSEPAEYAHFGKHAPKAKSDDDIVTIPTDSKGKALVAFRESIQFQLLVDSLACTLSSVTVSSSTLSNVSCSMSSNVANISCAEGASLGTTAQTIVFKVVGTLSGASYTDYVTVKVVPNVTGADGDGYEYVYYLSSSSSASSIPTPRRQNGVLTNGWKDDPMAPTKSSQYVWVAYKKGAVGSDGTFSAPKLFNRYPRSIDYQTCKYLTTSSLSAPQISTVWNSGSTTMPTDFNDTYPWLWKLTRTFFTDNTTEDSLVCEGYKAKDGIGIKSVNTWYGLSSNMTTQPSSYGYDTLSDIVIKDNHNMYVWSADKVTYTDNKTGWTGAYCIGKCSDLVSVREEYGTSTSEGTKPSSWNGTYPDSAPKGTYIWSHDVVEWKNGTTTTSDAQLIGYIATDGLHAPKATCDDDKVTIPTDSSGNALVSFEESIGFSLYVDGTACNISSVTKVSDSLSYVSCSISSNVARISCSKGATLGKNAQQVKFKVVGTLNGKTYTDRVIVKVIPNVMGEDGDGYEYVYLLSNSSTAPTSRPYRSGGTLYGGWVDDPPSPTDSNRYVYVSYHQGVVGAPTVPSTEWSSPSLWAYKAPKGQDGQDGQDGKDGKDGKDGVGFVTAYQRAEKMPTSKPTAGTYTAYDQSTGDLGNSWLKAAPANISLKSGGSISGTVQYNQNLNGDAWFIPTNTVDGYSWYQCPASMTNQDKANGFCSMQVRFTTTVDDQYVTFYLKAYSEENWDFILLSKLDSATVSKSNCYSQASGNGKTVQVQMKCGKAGSHFVTVAYSKDGSDDKNGDYVLFRMATSENYVYVETLLYRCDGKVSPEKNITWGNIYQASGNNGEKGEKGDPGEPGAPGAAGDRGTRGPIPRTHNGMESGSYNYLQGADDEAYVDLVYRNSTWYRCIRSHTASTFISSYWESSQTKGWTFMATELLLAENAKIDMMSSQEINLLSDASTLFGSFRWVRYNTDYAFWLGGTTGDAATTSITKGGKLKSTSAEITGKIVATSGQIGGFKLEDNNLVCSNARLVIGEEGNNFTRMVVLDAKSFTYASYNFALSVVNYGIVTQSSATQAGIHINVGSSSNTSTQYPGIVMENGTFVGLRVPVVPLSYSMDLRNNASIYASGMCIRCNNSSNITITLPTSATGAKTGDVFTVIRAGTGDVTIKAPTGVNYHTASGRSGDFTSSKRYEHIQLVFDGDTWFSECSNDS